MSSKKYKVDKFYLKVIFGDDQFTQWGLWDDLFNYNNALDTLNSVNIFKTSDNDSHFKLDIHLQLYNTEK